MTAGIRIDMNLGAAEGEPPVILTTFVDSQDIAWVGFYTSDSLGELIAKLQQAKDQMDSHFDLQFLIPVEDSSMIEKVNVAFVKTHPDVKVPEYKTPGSAGCDVHAFLPDSVGAETIGVGETKIVPTGLKVAVPPGFEIQVRTRSGMAAGQSMQVLNSPGTIDSDYRGEIMVILHNAGSKPYHVNHGDRVAQLVLNRVPQIVWVDAGIALDDTERGEGGFGSTGLN